MMMATRTRDPKISAPNSRPTGSPTRATTSNRYRGSRSHQSVPVEGLSSVSLSDKCTGSVVIACVRALQPGDGSNGYAEDERSNILTLSQNIARYGYRERRDAT